MERFIVVGALIFAGLVALSPMINDGRPFEFHISDADEDDVAGPQSSGAPGSEQVFAADSVTVRDIAAIVTVTAEDRGDVAVTINGGAGLNVVRPVLEGDTLVLDGGYRRSRGCQSKEGGLHVEIGGRSVSASELPQITLKMPRDVRMSVSGAVSTTIGDAGLADLNLNSCADTRIGALSGDLDANLAGSGDLIVAAVGGQSTVSIAGSGGVVLTKANDVEANVAGSGSTRLDTLTGDLKASIAGSGDLRVGAGQVGEAELSVAGSGDIRIDAPIDVLDAEVVGSGQVKVGPVREVRKQSVWGSGEIHLDAPPAPPQPPQPPAPPKPI